MSFNLKTTMESSIPIYSPHIRDNELVPNSKHTNLNNAPYVEIFTINNVIEIV